jgi:asparagine synthase (glutamine-hydrolysing)
MCGIAALLGKHKPECAAAMVRTMNDALAHRGPDDQGAVVLQVGDGIVGLANRRLAILDLSPHGHQPMHNPDTGDVLVYNGEIYNSPELRRELQQAGFSFRGHSDTEVLLRAYQRWGVDCLPRLRGMFAFALWDARRSRLLIARDHLGIKPLYYAARQGEWFVCASEIRALMSSGLPAPVISQRALAGYLAYGAVQEPLTLFQGVFTLPRGSWKEFDSLGRTTAQGTYWQFPQVEQGRERRMQEVAAEGRALLEQAVRRHLLSDVRVGIFLSSGLDSTAILGIARQFQSATEHLHAFTVSFSDDPVYDEAAIARVTAARFGVQYHEYPVEESTALAWMRDGLAAMDQPSMDGFNTYMVARAVREQGIIVALSGMGGDELLAGYNSFRRVPRMHRALSWIASLPPSWRAAIARNLPLPMNSVVRSKAADIAAAGPDVLAIYFQTRRLLSDQSLVALGLEPSALGLSPGYQVPELSGEEWITSDPITSVARLESGFYLQNMLLRDSDVFGMAASLEIRVPLLDLDVVDWALRLPGDVLLPKGAPSKYLLRTMCANFYTRAQLEQGKRGFIPPIGLWLAGPLRETMEESLRSLKNSGLIDPAGIAPITETFLREPGSPAWSRVWAMVTLGYWFEQHKSAPVAVA